VRIPRNSWKTTATVSNCSSSASTPHTGDTTEDYQAFLVGNRADRINHRSGGRLLEQPQQHGSSVGPTHPAEGTGRFPRHNMIGVVEQFEQQPNDGGRARTAATAGADLRSFMPEQ
jgi:hypothetical protein